MGLHPERPRTPARCSGRLRTYRPRGRPPSGSGTARSSGPSGLRKGGGAGNPSQRGTQRNRKGSPRWTETTSRSHGPVHQSEGSEADGAARGTFRAVSGVQTQSRDPCCKLLVPRSQVRRLLSAWGTGVSAAPLHLGLDGLRPAYARRAPLRLSLGKCFPSRNVFSPHWDPESRRRFTSPSLGCWCFSGILAFSWPPLPTEC